ncbi:IS630 family transposase [Thermosulfuriphilus ammonigenes]|uniref:IS630 family transposase n=2 Tax=Thermosulfuriphilus ammonigenes TaxID=1936021 RepID=A0A6G7PZ07_9BACT|nr:IS630 family transposase [Thermosulfuriphilus ammonigenes]QIJ72678.1 IS630 family transposase [Thermosulfuriphilus ammonigenes]
MDFSTPKVPRIDARKLPPKAQEALRFRAVHAVLEQGKTQEEVAQMLGIARTTVTYWLKLYRQGGEEALKIKPRGRPKGGKLLGWQAATICSIIRDRCPDQLKLPFSLWTREAVGQLIERKFGIRLSIWTVGRYLRRWNFTPQKPLKRAYERNPKEVKAWLEKEYPRIRKRAKEEGAEIWWGDETGIRSDHQAGRSWAPRGETPVVEVSGKRFRFNMISAINNRGKLKFMIFRERFTTEVFLEFLRRLIRSREKGRKIYLIVDNHRVHRAKRIKEWLKGKEDELELHYLPRYSPELNPDEYLNQDVKTNAGGRRRKRNMEEMEGNVRSYLMSTQRQPEIVRSYFRAPMVRYALD